MTALLHFVVTAKESRQDNRVTILHLIRSLPVLTLPTKKNKRFFCFEFTMNPFGSDAIEAIIED
jgi:hypothetical protein